jgi:hypothetical protein
MTPEQHRALPSRRRGPGPPGRDARRLSS